jgi:SAM-dependent methyltransferase
MKSNIIKGVEQYYSDKIMLHGDSAQGVDWNSTDSQYLRFDQLSQLFEFESDFSLLDYGCGSGEFVTYIDKLNLKQKIKYVGFDVSEPMLSIARKKNRGNVLFNSVLPDFEIDFTIASGLFNVKLNLATEEQWFNYIIETISEINSISEKGFAFNALTKYSDKEFMKDYLYYSDPLVLFDYCKRNFSKNVALLHDYNLFEFTIIVRK